MSNMFEDAKSRYLNLSSDKKEQNCFTYAVEFNSGQEEVPVEAYLLDPFLPLTDTVGFFGRGGSGKSSFLASCAASISNEATTLWISSEEQTAHIKVRHERAGGEIGSIAVSSHMPRMIETGESKPFSTTEDLEPMIIQVKKGCRKDRPLKLVVLDAAKALFGWEKGETPDQDKAVQRAIAHLKDLANQHQVCIAFIGHLNKRSEEEKYAADAVNGAGAWTNSPRRSFILRVDESVDEDYSFYIRTAKTNFTATARRYKTVPAVTIHQRENGHHDILCTIEFQGDFIWGESKINAEFATEEQKERKKSQVSKREADKQARATAAFEAIKQGRTTREAVHVHMQQLERDSKPFTTNQWQDIDFRLVAFGVKIETGAHGHKIYRFEG